MHWTESVAGQEQLAGLAKLISKVMDLARMVAASKSTQVRVCSSSSTKLLYLEGF